MWHDALHLRRALPEITKLSERERFLLEMDKDRLSVIGV